MDNYIYLIKYNGNIIAAASDDKNASATILHYMLQNKDMRAELFDKEAIRYFDRTCFATLDKEGKDEV